MAEVAQRWKQARVERSSDRGILVARTLQQVGQRRWCDRQVEKKRLPDVCARVVLQDLEQTVENACSVVFDFFVLPLAAFVSSKPAEAESGLRTDRGLLVSYAPE